MRTIKAQHKAVYEPVADLITYRAMPTQSAPMNLIDPFIFLNHHGRQEYQAHNNGLPFGPHPHRGFETVTFILEGDLTHKDSSGIVSVIKEGGVQWMTAGSGLIHAEVSSDEFKATGGPLEILQLWVNLPAKYKMIDPKYVGLQKEDIPVLELDNGKVAAHIVSGEWEGTKGPFEPLTDIHLSFIYFKEGGKYTIQIPKEQNVFLYIVKGEIKVNGDFARIHHLVEFNHDGKTIEMKATVDAVILFGYATPFNEPFFAYGPFVMNTREEIMQAYEDMKNGKFGDAEELA
ncbi:MAG TPA: pirin family protein [Segetibacter sp.]|nr:pirin family protein [Segetibacter sp.]